MLFLIDQEDLAWIRLRHDLSRMSREYDIRASITENAEQLSLDVWMQIHLGFIDNQQCRVLCSRYVRQ